MAPSAAASSSASANSTLTFTLFATITVFVFSVDFATSFSSNDTFPNCNQTFSCGNLTNIYHPFTGGPRPPYCGLPGFQLSCVDNSTTLLTINSMNYRVIEINQTDHSLLLSRSDLFNTTCTSLLINTTFNNTLFTFGSNNEILSLFYGCNFSVLLDPYKSQNSFNCEIHGKKDAYYLFGPVPNDPILGVFECRATITVPILLDWVGVLESNKSLLGEVLRKGFNASYSNPFADDCDKCYSSGGHCGFDISLGNSLCICDNDRPCPGLAIAGATIISTLLGCYYYFTRRHRFWTGKTVKLRGKNAKQEQEIETFIMNYHSLMPKRYSYSDIMKMTNSLTEKLGQGGFGGVYKGKLSDGRLVAVKVLTKLAGDGEEFINEVASISRTSHVNIVTLLGFCYERTKRALVYEYMPNGSLDKFIYNEGSQDTICHLERKKLYEIANGIARGLEYLHRGCNTRIVHFDIKPQNILLDDDFCPKIADFGLAKLCKGKESKVSMLGTRGTVGYIAPEVFMRSFGGISYKSDVYSYGMMILEMFGVRNITDN